MFFMQHLPEWFWQFIAHQIVTRPHWVNAIIEYSKKTPYFDLEGYMNRWWTFNPHDKTKRKRKNRWWHLVSIRIHHILREDLDRHLHDHPWNARTIILKGWYQEERQRVSKRGTKYREFILRKAGDSAKLNFGEFHRINNVSHGGVWTLFITFGYQGVWGFEVNDEKIPHYTYLGEEG